MEPRKAKEKIPKGHYGCSGRRGNCRHRRLSDNTDSFTSYFSRVLKQVHMGLSLSQEAMNVMSSFMIDIFQGIARGWALGPPKQAPHHHLQRDPDFCELAAAWGDGQTCQINAGMIFTRYGPCHDIRAGWADKARHQPSEATRYFPLSCGEGESEMNEPSSKLSEEDLGNEETEFCEVEPFETEPRKAKEKTSKGHRCCSCSGHHSRRPSKSIESFTSYFPRVLKQVHMGLSLSQEAVNIMKSFSSFLDVDDVGEVGQVALIQRQQVHDRVQVLPGLLGEQLADGVIGISGEGDGLVQAGREGLLVQLKGLAEAARREEEMKLGDENGEASKQPDVPNMPPPHQVHPRTLLDKRSAANLQSLGPTAAVDDHSWGSSLGPAKGASLEGSESRSEGVAAKTKVWTPQEAPLQSPVLTSAPSIPSGPIRPPHGRHALLSP
ncbi:hypothetical protein Celaphus_00009757 [Cervus elaphus hippelaphus]|uniref:Uncharacterized protein n=1 Tax=Cervus elaphus hippelaphus TaxID=46360 RepID=A0A212BZV9_CEREH|nr:hypothetical protein Celaphus_00009757 [Cervus elaphus hippelaphus]